MRGPDDTLIDGLYSGTVIISVDGTLVFASQTVREIFGYAAHPVEGMHIAEFFGWDVVPKIDSFLKDNRSAQKGETFSILGMRKDNTIISCLVKLSVSSVFLNQYIMLEILDLNRLRNAEQKMFKQNRQFMQMANNLPGVVYKYRLRPQKRLEYVSEGIRDLAGYRSADFYGNHALSWDHIIFEKDLRRVREVKSSQLVNLGKFDINYRITRKDGSPVWVKDQGKGLYDQRGHLAFVEGNILDISDLKNNQLDSFVRIMHEEDMGKSRIASNINDNLHQYMAMASIQLKELEKDIGKVSTKSRKAYLSGMKFLLSAINSSRNISYDLIPKSIQDFGLLAALEDLFLILEKQYHVKIRFINEVMNLCLNSFQENSLFIIIREIFGMLTRNNILDDIRVSAVIKNNVLSLSVRAKRNRLKQNLFKEESRALANLENRTRALQAEHQFKIFRNSFFIFSLDAPINMKVNGSD